MIIVYLIDQFQKHGGIEKMVSLKINYFIEHYGYDVVLITSNHPAKAPFIYNLNEKVIHIDLGINYQIGKSYFHPVNLLKAFKHYRKLNNLIQDLKPDVIVSAGFSPEQYFLPFLAKKIPKIKEFHFSGTIFKQKRNLFLNAINKILFQQFKKYDAVVILNDDEKKYFDFDNLVVIPNFIESIPILRAQNREKTIIAAGRMAAVKQFDHLILAWSYIALQFPDWDVKIFGDGNDDLSENLNELISSQKTPRIQLMGATAYLNIEMQKASLYAMTSANECFPMVLIEAQSAGLPVISYDCPNGPRNIINDGKDGLLVKNQDQDELLEKLVTLMTDESVRIEMSNKAYENSLRFAEASIMDQWNVLMWSLR